MNDLRFDQHQFAGRGGYPVNATNRISFDDYSRMRCATHGAKPTAFVPPFALNDKQLQRVLLVRAWRFVKGKGGGRGTRGSRPIPENIEREEINQVATAKALAGHEIRADAAQIQHEMVEKQKAAVRGAGGFLQLHASIAFRSWRLGMNSVEVAESLDMNPATVRQALWRLRAIAKVLGYEVGRAGHTAGTTHKRKFTAGKKRKPEFSAARAVELFTAGKTLTDIAVTMGYQRGHGKNRVRRALMAAGVYRNTKPGHGGPAVADRIEGI
jgi:hypothetical protein